MALSRTEVINAALGLIAVDSISDPDENSEPARRVKAIYEMAVRSAVEEHAWYFAKVDAPPTPASGTSPLFKFAYEYTMPADFIRLVELDGQWVFTPPPVHVGLAPAYELFGRSVRTDLPPPLQFTYLRDLSNDPTMWSPLFVDVAAGEVAERVAMSLTKEVSKVQVAQKFKEMALRRAKHANAIQRAPDYVSDGSWVTARLGA